MAQVTVKDTVAANSYKTVETPVFFEQDGLMLQSMVSKGVPSKVYCVAAGPMSAMLESFTKPMAAKKALIALAEKKVTDWGKMTPDNAANILSREQISEIRQLLRSYH